MIADESFSEPFTAELAEVAVAPPGVVDIPTLQVESHIVTSLQLLDDISGAAADVEHSQIWSTVDMVVDAARARRKPSDHELRQEIEVGAVEETESHLGVAVIVPDRLIRDKTQ
jgi:hypothetical protein